MHILRIEHAVPDFESWKAAFDGDPIGRERSGVRRYRVMRASDDAGDPGRLERVGHPRAVVVAGGVDEDLGLPLQATK